MLKLKVPRTGFYLLLSATVLSAVAFGLYFGAFDALSFGDDKWVIALTVFSFWSMAVLMVNSLFAGDEPSWTGVFYVITVMALLVSMARLLMACLSPIGIYFTVNMGNMEAYALGVPRCIAGVACYLVATICVAVSAFFSPTKERRTNV